MTADQTFHTGDVVTTPGGLEYEVVYHDGDTLVRLSDDSSVHPDYLTLVYRPPTREEVEAMRQEIKRLRADVAQLTRNRDFWRGIAGHGEGEGFPECNS